jgi:membrane protein DedA with SNARE-associated domain
MQQALEFLLHHIEMVVFLTVLAEQVGLPIPAMPVLLAAGAVAGGGEANLTATIDGITTTRRTELDINPTCSRRVLFTAKTA